MTASAHPERRGDWSPRWIGGHDSRPAEPDGGDPAAPARLGLGVHVVLADDPVPTAEAVAEQLGAPLVTSTAEAERTMARFRSERRAAGLLAEATEAARLAEFLDSSQHGDGTDPSPLLEEELRAAVATGLTAAAVLEEAEQLAAALAAARAWEEAAEQGRDEAAARAESALPGRLADVAPETARAAAAAAADAHEEAERARRAVGAPPPDPTTEARHMEELRRSEAGVVRQLAAARRAEAVLSPLLVLAALVAALTGLWLALAGRVPMVVAVVVPAVVVGIRIVTGRLLQALQTALDDQVRDLQGNEIEEHELWQEHSRALRAWKSRVAEATRAEERHALARQAWEALAGADADPLRVDELLEREAAAREAAAALASAEAELDQARVLLAPLLAAWHDHLGRVGLDPGTQPSECLEELRRRQAAGAAASARLDHLRARSEAAARLRDLLHGRRLERLLAEASSCGPVDGSPGVVVLVNLLHGLGPGRRRQLLRDLAWWGRAAALVLVTPDDEVAAWVEQQGGSLLAAEAVSPSHDPREPAPEDRAIDVT